MAKYDDRYEEQLVLLVENNLARKNFKTFDRDARVIRRERIPELREQDRTSNENCLVAISRDGETIVITEEFEIVLYTVLKNRFDSISQKGRK